MNGMEKITARMEADAARSLKELEEQTERQLMEAVPRDRWSHTHHLLIWHGRRCCTARKPACERCPIVQCEYLNKPSNE